jgi:hypothetical protein
VSDPLLAAFEAGTLSPESFHHADHVHLAWLYLRDFPPLEAITRFAEGLKRFARSVGKEGLYHETITWAYLLLIRERMARSAAGFDTTWDAFAGANLDLLTWRPSVLDRYYRTETLASDLARRVFLLPDRSLT